MCEFYLFQSLILFILMPPKKRKLAELYENDEPLGRQPFSKRRKVNDRDLIKFIENEIDVSNTLKQ